MRSVAFLAVCLAVGASLVQATCPYVIQGGDTFWQIAKSRGVDVGAITALNPGVKPEALSIGQTIQVPCQGEGKASCPYVIQGGDTFWQIAKSRGVDVGAITTLNPGVKPEALSVGQTIQVPCQGGDKASCPYVIKGGDTFWEIAKSRGVDVGAITALNPGVKPEALSVGQTIQVPCQGGPAVPPSTNVQTPVDKPETKGGVSDLISAQQWDTIFAHRNDQACQGAKNNFYNYNAFTKAAAEFPQFATSSDNTNNKRELAAFLAHISHETTGGWDGAPDGRYSWGLCWITEGRGTPPANAATAYCTASAEYACEPGKLYFGRGPIQLSHNYNYIQAGRALGFDGLKNPEIIEKDPLTAFKTAIWFWMTPQPPKPSAHDVMTGRVDQTATGGRSPGFGLTTNIINGALECGKGNILDQEKDRIGFFKRYTEILGVSAGDNLDCANQKSY